MEIIIVALLAVVAGCEVYRTYLGKKTPTQYDHFKRRLDGTRGMIWDLQFKVFKTREIREDIRKEYDMMQSRIAGLDKQITEFPKDGNVDELKRLQDQKVLAERDSNRFVAQMKQLDVEVEGAKPSAENPNGADGIVQQIDSLRELESMLKSYLKA